MFEMLGDLVNRLTKEKCPKCGQHRGKYESEEVTNREHFIKTEQVKEDHYDNEGNFTGSTKRPQQVTKIKETYLEYYRCGNCNHRWYERKSRIRTP